MGVKGLQQFVDHCCPDACVTVDLREMARQHVAKCQQGDKSTAKLNTPTLVVDGMACLRHWYSCKDWVCGGQWKEYMSLLERWLAAFTSAGINLVFFFDGVVEEQKRQEWVKRRRRVNVEVSKVFRYIKTHGEQPGRELFCLPSGLASFTPFALRSLGQMVFCSVQEADYEIARYARCHDSMGILGQDSDFIIYDSAPYLSVAQLRLDGLTTVRYDRQCLCRAIGLAPSQLPLLACLLGNDVVSEDQMQHVRSDAMAVYRRNKCLSPGASKGDKVLALAQLLSSAQGKDEAQAGIVPPFPFLSACDKEILERGVRSYLLPDQKSDQGVDIPTLSPSSARAMERYVNCEILKSCRERHIAAEGFMVYSVVCEGVVECSNTLEDEADTELLPQALVFKPLRQRIYSLLLQSHHGSNEDVPAVKEWFVFPGNQLKQPDMVSPTRLNLPGDQPSLELLWFGIGQDISDLRWSSFLTVLDCQDFSQLYQSIDDSLLTTLCLVTSIILQVQHLSLEDMDAYLSQAVCLRLKSFQDLQHIKLPYISSRAVQLGSLYVRGLGYLLGANCASGSPLPNAALMPWHSFDGRLFHSKYILSHSGTDHSLLLDSDPSCLSMFLRLREKLLETCRKRGRTLQSRPRPQHYRCRERPDESTHTVWDRDRRTEREERRGGYRSRGEETRRNQRGFRSREEFREGGQAGGENRRPLYHPRCHEESFHHSGSFPTHSGAPTRQPNRGRYQLAPRCPLSFGQQWFNHLQMGSSSKVLIHHRRNDLQVNRQLQEMDFEEITHSCYDGTACRNDFCHMKTTLETLRDLKKENFSLKLRIYYYEKDGLSDNIQEIVNELAKLKNTYDEQAAALSACQTDRDALQLKVEELIVLQKQAEAEIHSLKEEKSQLLNEFDETKGFFQDLWEKWGMETKSLLEEQVELVQDIHNLKRKLAQREAEIMFTKNSKLEKEVTDLTELVAKLQADRASLEHKVAVLSACQQEKSTHLLKVDEFNALQQQMEEEIYSPEKKRSDLLYTSEESKGISYDFNLMMKEALMNLYVESLKLGKIMPKCYWSKFNQIISKSFLQLQQLEKKKFMMNDIGPESSLLGHSSIN